MSDRVPFVSVVIPVRNSAATVERAVASALGQDYSGDLEVILAEGASDDGSRAVVERLSAAHEAVRVVDNPTGATPSGLNAAITASTGDVIVRCDAHAELPPGYVANAVRRLRETEAGVVGGVQDAVGVTSLERAVAYAMANPLGSGGAAYRTPGREGIAETVYLGVFPRAVFAEVGLFDESLRRSQDYELNHRIAAAGHAVYFAPELRVQYRPRGSVAALWRQYFAYGRWKRLVVRRSPGSLRPRQLAAPLLVTGLVASIVLGATPWRWLGAIVPAVYLLAVLGATVVELVRRRDPAAALIAIVLPTMHIAWGSGFWRAGVRAGQPTVPSLGA